MNKIQVYQNYIQIIASSTDIPFLSLIDQVKGIEKQRARDTYRCSIHLLPEVLKILRGIEDSSSLQSPIKEYYEEEMLRRRMTSELLQNGPDEEYAGLWNHQNLGVCLAKYNRRFNFFYDTRTGKTRMSYQIMLNALKAGKAKRCLVVAPATIIPDWLSDAKQFPELKVVAYYKNEKQKLQALTTPSHIVLWSLGTFVDNLELLKKIKFDMVIFDESSKLKNHRSATAKAALELSETVPSWYNLSATPAPNGEHEYYIQMRCVDPYCFNSARTHFVNKYFINMSRDSRYEKLRLNPVMYDEFMQKIKEHSIFVDQSVMPMADKVWKVVEYDMSAATAEIYKQMASDAAIQLADDTTITAEQAASIRAKLSQITSGFVLDSDAIKRNIVSRKLGEAEDAREVYQVGDLERLRVLRTTLDFIHRNDPDASVIIWANYAEEFAMLKGLLGSGARVIRGGTSTAAREDIIAGFRTKQFRYLLAHPLSVGMGVNLTVAHWAVYYSINDSWEALKQSSERICGHISIQPHTCRYLVLAARGSVNQIVYENVINKRDDSLALLEHVKAVALR